MLLLNSVKKRLNELIQVINLLELTSAILVQLPVTGEDFYRALLRIWLGENPVQADLKKALLGEKQ